MLKTDTVIKLLKKEKKAMTFDDIWKTIKEETMSSLSKEGIEEFQAKSDLYMSLLEEQKLIMIGENKWDLKENFSHDDIALIERTRMTEELELDLDLEKTDDTIELEILDVEEEE